jgi:hypothetical protein
MMYAADMLAPLRGYLQRIDDPVARDFCQSVDWDMAERRLVPAKLPCVRHLDRALRIAPRPGRHLVALLDLGSRILHWGQTYTAADFGEKFIRNYGWMELFGSRGHFVNDTVAAGFLVLGPDIFYPDHHHKAAELYIPLTEGSEWRKDDGPFVARRAGEVIHHPSNVSHAMRTHTEPLVALYLWRDGPLDEVSVVEPRPPVTSAEATVELDQALAGLVPGNRRRRADA